MAYKVILEKAYELLIKTFDSPKFGGNTSRRAFHQGSS